MRLFIHSNRKYATERRTHVHITRMKHVSVDNDLMCCNSLNGFFQIVSSICRTIAYCCCCMNGFLLNVPFYDVLAGILLVIRL